MEFLLEGLKAVTWQQVVMYLVGFGLIYLAIKKEYEPSLLLPMGFGAILVNLFVPDKNGEVKDVVLGYDRAKDYFVNGSCFGSTIGPVANRTAKGQFELDGTIYNLTINDNDNNLHSDGNAGLHKTMWQAEKKDTILYIMAFWPAKIVIMFLFMMEQDLL